LNDLNEIMENQNENESLEHSDPSDGSPEPCSEPQKDERELPDDPSLEAAPDPTAGELDSLRAQVQELRERLAEREREREESLRELEDFHRLFPHVPVRQIPDRVWDDRGRGIPLSAAYALYERELAVTQAQAERINQANATQSAGRAGVDTANEYFSPDEVRRMTRAQVRQNYTKIRESMKKWN